MNLSTVLLLSVIALTASRAQAFSFSIAPRPQRAATYRLYGKQLLDIDDIENVTDSYTSYAERAVKPPAKKRWKPASKNVFERRTAKTSGGRFSKDDKLWNERFRKLEEYKEKHGDTLVPQNYEKDPSLGHWVNKQRTEYKRRNTGKPSSLDNVRIKHLNEIGFDWNPSETKWAEMYQRLVQYKAEHGDTLVPRSYRKDPKLANWVSTQRAQGRRLIEEGKYWLTKERFDRLEAIGFEWDPHEAKWNEMYHRLVRYKADHGDTAVPVIYPLDQELGNWVNTQRAQGRKLIGEGKSQLTKDRFDRLKAIGFEWDPSEATWNEMYQRLIQYKAEHGDTLVPRSYGKDPKLGIWVKRQREEGRKLIREGKSQLTKDRFDRLEATGFEWTVLPPRPPKRNTSRKKEENNKKVGRREQFEMERRECQ